MNADQINACRGARLEKAQALGQAKTSEKLIHSLAVEAAHRIVKSLQATDAAQVSADDLQKASESLRELSFAAESATRWREQAEREYKTVCDESPIRISQATVDCVRAAFLQPGRKAGATDCSKVKQLTGKVRFHAGVNETFVLQVEEEYHPDFVSLPGGELLWRDATASDFDELSVTVTSQRNTPPANFHSPLLDECMKQLNALSREPGISEEAIARARRDFLGVRPKQTDGGQNG